MSSSLLYTSPLSLSQSISSPLLLAPLPSSSSLPLPSSSMSTLLCSRSSMCKKNHRIYSVRAWLTRSVRFCISEASTSSLYAASDTFTGDQTPFGCVSTPFLTQPPSPPSSSPFAVLVTDPSLSSTQLMGCVLSYQAWQIMMTSGLGCFQSSL